MSYLKAFIAANWKQITNGSLSLAVLILLFKHPEWKPYVLSGGAVLASWGLHLDPVVYDPEKLVARLRGNQQPELTDDTKH